MWLNAKEDMVTVDALSRWSNLLSLDRELLKPQHERRTMRVLALVPYPTGRVGGQRYRIEQWARLLSAEGIAVEFSPFLSPRDMEMFYRPGYTAPKAWAMIRGYWQRVTALVRRWPADVVFIYREAALLGPAWLEGMASWRLPLVFDFDDAIHLRDTSPANSWARRLKPQGKAGAICRFARHVTVGNDLLAEFAGKYARAVTVVPSTIDTEIYQAAERPRNARPIVGWTGSVTTLSHLVALGPALRRLRQRLEFELRVIGSETTIEGVPVRCVPWRSATEVEDLQPLDVGLMPLPDDEWSRHKCGMKALQYMALGIPPVVSPVGVNTTIVRDGVNGFYAANDDEWVDRIARLLRNPSLRRAFGEEARKTIETTYSARVHAPRMGHVLRKAAGQ
jgi:glycosyltransferase involved in cell wall biosynthesis